MDTIYKVVKKYNVKDKDYTADIHIKRKLLFFITWWEYLDSVYGECDFIEDKIKKYIQEYEKFAKEKKDIKDGIYYIK